MTPQKLARCVEMAINGAKSAYPGMQPADAFLGDLTIMARTLIAGAVSPSPKPRAAKRNLQENRQKPRENRPQIRRSQMSTMTINGRSPPCPTIPTRC